MQFCLVGFGVEAQARLGYCFELLAEIRANFKVHNIGIKMKKIIRVALLLALPLVAVSQAFIASAEDVKLEVTDAAAVKNSLEKLVGKSVALRLANGEDIAGIVEQVGPTAVRVGQLTGKEFYSAVVALDRISAVVYRAK